MINVSKLIDGRQWVEQSITRLAPRYSRLIPTLQLFAMLCWSAYERVAALRVNPTAHHFVVFDHAVEVGAALDRDDGFMLRKLTLALGHDTSSEAMKITKQEVEQLRAHDPARGAVREIERQTGRLVHLYDGGLYSLNAMQTVNTTLGPVYEPDTMFDVTFGAVRHDWPSLGRAVPMEDELLSSFIDCDALWLVACPEADLWRNGENTADPGTLRRQLVYNMKNLHQRRKAYGPDAQFQGRTCLRYVPAYEIYLRYLREWAIQLGTTVPALEKEAYDPAI